VNRLRRRAAALVAIGVVGVVAGCAPATPSGTAKPATSPAPSPPPSLSPVPTPAAGLVGELDVRRVDPALTDTILEFASDGTSVIFSSGVADDAAPNAAPDLWRIRADADEPPELVWRNPERDHSIVKLGGDVGTVAFVEIPLDGSRAWNLWLIARDGEEPLLLDTHPGDEDVSSLVPSLSIQESTIAWTAFDIGPGGPVSQLLWAQAPGWEPTVVLERPAAEAELWFPWLDSGRVAYGEVRYSADRDTDTRSVHLLDLGVPGAEPRRLDASDRATMPVLSGDLVVWKEADPGFSMFNWGRLFRHEIGGGGGTAPLDTGPHDYVNYPSLGARFVAWWAADAFQFVVYDLLEDRPMLVERHTASAGTNVLRPHVAGDLLVWLHVEGEGGPASHAELRYAFLPPVRSPR